MKKHTLLQDTLHTIEILKDKPNIDQKVSYYKSIVKLTDKLIHSITDKIKSGGYHESIRLFGFIPVVKKIKYTPYEITKLEIERVETEAQLDAQKNYFEMWLTRSAEYEKKFDEVSRDCNNNWDSIMIMAEEVKKTNFRLSQVMEKYSNPDNDVKMKVEYYLYVKKEVENNLESKQKKFKVA